MVDASRGKLNISTGTLLNHYKLKKSHLDRSESCLSLIVIKTYRRTVHYYRDHWNVSTNRGDNQWRIQTFRLRDGGGGGAGHPDPEKVGGGWSQKLFFPALRASGWFKNKVGGGGRVPRSPSLIHSQNKSTTVSVSIASLILLGFTFCQAKCHSKGKMVRTIATRRSII